MSFVANYAGNILSLASGRPARRPLLASYYITHRCGLACAYCCDGAGRPFKEDIVSELATAEVKKLLTILRQATDTLDITGGEPMLRSDLEEILGFARSIGLRTVLNTKGIGLPARNELMKSLDVLVLSVDSLDSHRLATLTGASAEAAGEILGTLRWAAENRSKHERRIVLAAVATPENLQDVAQVLRFAEEHHLGFQVSPRIVGMTIHPGLRDSEDYRALMSKVIAAKRGGAAVYGTYRYLRSCREAAAFKCQPLLMPTIRPDGRLYYPCLETGRATVSVLEAGSYALALIRARQDAQAAGVDLPDMDCQGRCHIFCHMALSLLQRHPLAALGELRLWRN